MSAEQPFDPRTHPVSFDITAPRPQAQHQAERAEQPDRVESRLTDVEHRLDVLEGGLAMLADAIYGKGKKHHGSN